MQFDLQTTLAEMRTEQREMRKEQREDVQELSTKVEAGFTNVHGRINSLKDKVNDHETRIVVIDGTRKTFLWLAGIAVACVVGGLIDLVFVHLPRLMKP